MQRLLTASQDSIPSFAQMVREWNAYCVLADRKPSKLIERNPYTGRRVREVVGVVDKSLPQLLSDNQTYYLRILDHNTKGLLIDLRRFVKKGDGLKEWYEPTEEGIAFPIGDWVKLLDPIFKLLKKWRNKNG